MCEYITGYKKLSSKTRMNDSFPFERGKSRDDEWTLEKLYSYRTTFFFLETIFTKFYENVTAYKL